LAEEALEKARAGLERRVEERTAELSRANHLLKKEIEERALAEVRSNIFSSLGQRLSQVRNAKEAAQLILDTADQLLKWDAAYLHLFTPDHKVQPVLMFDLVNGRRTIVPDNTRDDGLSERDQRTIDHGPELILRTRDELSGSLRLFGDNKPSLSLMYVPIRHGAKAVGVLSIQSYTERFYSDDKLQTLQTLADFCGGTLERIQTEQALREAETRFTKAFSSSPVPMTLTLLRSGKYIAINDATCKLFGYRPEEIVGRTSIELGIWPTPEARQAMVDRVLQNRSVRDMETKFRSKSGALKSCLVSVEQMDFAGEPTILVTIHDVTDRLSLEEQLRHAQKMEGIGQLAAGIAHDFNNILTVIQGHAGLLSTIGGMNARVSESIAQIGAAADKASHLTRQLLTFSRKQKLSPRSLDLNDVIGNTARMLQRMLGEDIVLDFERAPSLPSIQADSGMIEQVLVNLVVNARDAMPNGGRVVMRTTVVDVAAGQLQHNPEARAGQFVCLTVADTGTGIAPEHLSKIFEPFFTTKEEGKGTGLGLAMAYGIIKQHQGWIEVQSELQRGTTFKIYLPVGGLLLETPEIEIAPVAPAGKKETIFVVEDEPALRELVKEILQFHGYDVVEAIHGKDALRIWPEKRENIDLLLTDIVMPEGVSGLALATKLKADQPELKVIYTSGYSMDLFNADQTDGFDFLPKPYHPQVLVKKIRDCLDGRVNTRR
jgi:PAS domain S-box-containing protein